MTRVILVIFIAAVVFVLVWTFAPGVIRDFLQQAASPAAHPEESAKVAAPPAAAKPALRKKPANAPAESPKAPDTGSGAAAAVTVRGEAWQSSSAGPSTPSHPARPVFSVNTDTATLYSTNAAVGPVVSHLRKGEVVEPQFILNSAGQEWMFVSVTDRRVSGFLRAETLAKKQADPTSR